MPPKIPSIIASDVPSGQVVSMTYGPPVGAHATDVHDRAHAEEEERDPGGHAGDPEEVEEDVGDGGDRPSERIAHGRMVAAARGRRKPLRRRRKPSGPGR